MAHGRRGALLSIAGLLAVLSAAAPPARGATILVPEELALAAAIAAAQPGDTLSLAGTFDRIPAPFDKALTLLGRDPGNPPLLRGLVAGGCRLVDLRFAPATLTGDPAPLVTALGPLELVRCRFTGQTRVGVAAADSGTAPLSIDLVDCAFDVLVRAVDVAFAHPGSRVDIRGGTFRDLQDGVRLEAPPRDCPPGPSGEPPPVVPAAAALRIEGALFERIAGVAVRVANAASGLHLNDSRLAHYGRGVELVRAGARVDGCELDGHTDGAVGIDGVSCRLELVRSWVRFHATGVRLRRDGGCEVNAGFVGGDRESSCALTGNLVSIDSVDPIPVEMNWWGALDCAVAAKDAPGQTVRFLTDETRELLIDCGTPVRIATWSQIKAGRTR